MTVNEKLGIKRVEPEWLASDKIIHSEHKTVFRSWYHQSLYPNPRNMPKGPRGARIHPYRNVTQRYQNSTKMTVTLIPTMNAAAMQNDTAILKCRQYEIEN